MPLSRKRQLSSSPDSPPISRRSDKRRKLTIRLKRGSRGDRESGLATPAADDTTCCKITTAPECTCGHCIDGYISPRMSYTLRKYAEALYMDGRMYKRVRFTPTNARERYFFDLDEAELYPRQKGSREVPDLSQATLFPSPMKPATST